MRFSVFIAIMIVASVITLSVNAQTQNSPFSHLGSYGQVDTYCGRGGRPKDITNIPSLGCFILSPGHSATGTISGHQIEVSVDQNGQEEFKADGAVVTEVPNPPNNAGRLFNPPYVHATGSGYAFCQDDKSPSCPASIDIFSRNVDKTVLFTVSKCFPPNYHHCVLTQEMWDYYQSLEK